MKIDVMFNNSMGLHDYEVESAVVFENRLEITEKNGGKTYINLDNVNMYTLYEEKPEE